jgi:hypothetical protein
MYTATFKDAENIYEYALTKIENTSQDNRCFVHIRDLNPLNLSENCYSLNALRRCYRRTLHLTSQTRESQVLNAIRNSQSSNLQSTRILTQQGAFRCAKGSDQKRSKPCEYYWKWLSQEFRDILLLTNMADSRR